MRKYPSRMGVGASSILLILVVVSLTLFSVLSLLQARADAALTEKTALSINAFYDADARAQKMLSELDSALALGQDPTYIEGITSAGDQKYEFAIGSYDGHTLNVSVNVANGAVQVVRYRYESAKEWVGESADTVWQGDGA